MLKSKNEPPFFGGEVVSVAAYVLNKSPTMRLVGVMPKEAWIGHKPDVTNMRIFGSLCFQHVLDKVRGKLDNKWLPLFKIGYHSIRGSCLIM